MGFEKQQKNNQGRFRGMILARIRDDIDSFMARDPAARSRLEVMLCYPGVHALIVYRVTSVLWRRGWRLLARFLSHLGKLATHIEIHPGATIGKRLFIDHGSGVVIGETSVICDDVTIYQAVTLGGIAPSVDSHAQKDVKRHPTIDDGAIVGSGAQVLGNIVVGKDARVGANAVVSIDVPPGTTAVGIPAHVVMPKDKRRAREFMAYGTSPDGAPDPMFRDIDYLRRQMAALMDRIDELEDELRVYREADEHYDDNSADRPRGEYGDGPTVVITGKPQ